VGETTSLNTPWVQTEHSSRAAVYTAAVAAGVVSSHAADPVTSGL